MSAFIYADRPAQLGYTDPASGVVQLLPEWVVDANQLTRIERMIRQRSFGNLDCGAFFLRTWNDPTFGTPDGETPFDCRIFNPTTGYQQATPASSSLINKRFLT